MKTGALLLAVSLLFCATPNASDHADPIFEKRAEAGLTGLFAFPDGGQLVFVLDARPGLKTDPPYNLEPYRYRLHIDTHSTVTYSDPEDRLRYGGTIANPAAIKEDIVIDIALNNDGSLRSKAFHGLEDNAGIRLWTGVRDDPFIFPKFFGTNVVAMVVSVPLDAFPAGRRDWLVWATSHDAESGEQIDHVGRSNRTMNPRLDFLNKLHPSQHVAAISKRHDDPGFLLGLLMKRVAPMFAIRHYDFFPDVLIYTNRFPAGFPNGRKLEDDVATLTCRAGDCLLWELSYADSEAWPRITGNDKPFLPDFPYLAAPWPADPMQ